MGDCNRFLYPKHPYHGQFQPDYLVFNANLQEFAQRVGYVSGLTTGGKLTTAESYQQLQSLWQQFEQITEQLGIGDLPPSS
ncbi:hypothetical protein DO97_14300 [Neosynechococcus sphagnicola sy1]|uniref:Isopropylmalate/homocitrate/citramalate synthase n=1 Tax=Neosynechococcus sphagnicola sy1 TaxID=1497020 RepID=A0A098TH62_9CYAN|nr:hypothetical protein [Neosynechococcus sphagnicola]KGF71925.1 hypothetical protein DO97_14300 [Neosynechococcus sphagnicola sy1]